MSIQAAFSWKFPQEGIYDPTMFKLKILSFLFGATGLEELKGPSQIWDYTDLTLKRVTYLNLKSNTRQIHLEISFNLA